MFFFYVIDTIIKSITVEKMYMCIVNRCVITYVCVKSGTMDTGILLTSLYTPLKSWERYCVIYYIRYIYWTRIIILGMRSFRRFFVVRRFDDFICHLFAGGPSGSIWIIGKGTEFPIGRSTLRSSSVFLTSEYFEFELIMLILHARTKKKPIQFNLRGIVFSCSVVELIQKEMKLR